MKGKSKFGEKWQALESIHSVYERVVQDMDRLFKDLYKANKLESGEDTDEEDMKEIAVEAAGADVKVEEIEKNDVKISESDLKEEEEEGQPTASKKSRADRGKGKKKKPLTLRRSDCTSSQSPMPLSMLGLAWLVRPLSIATGLLLESCSCPVWEFGGSVSLRCNVSASFYGECYMSSQ